MMRTYLLAAALILLSAPVHAAYYDLGANGENKTNITWESRSTLETIVGRTNQVSGYAYFDVTGTETPAHRVSITFPVASMTSGIALRDEHMRSAAWLDAERFPTVAFESEKIRPVENRPNEYRITGNLTIHGVTRRITVPGRATRLPARPELERMGYVGEILHLETKFSVLLSDFGVVVPPNLLGLKMEDGIDLSFDVFGFTNNAPDRRPPEPEAAPATESRTSR